MGAIMRRVVRWILNSFLMYIVIASILFSPVQAHTVLGDMTGIAPYFRKNDHERNPTNTFSQSLVPGPVGYVWPGSGSNTYLNDPSIPPGYQSPFQGYELPLQAIGNKYSPEGAILTSVGNRDSVGDFVFAINFSKPEAFVTPSNPSPSFKYKSLTIYIPAPLKSKAETLEQDGFEPVGINWRLGETTNIITTLTDNYGNIFVAQCGPRDPFGPNWWMIRIVPSGKGIEFTSQRNWSEWYYVRVNQLRAPVIAGRYFFKMFLDDHYPVKEQGSPNLINSTIPMENWPVLLVKADPDPAIIHGTIRYGGSANVGLYGQPIRLAGRVRAVGNAIDRKMEKSSGKPVEARGYFNASSRGHFEVEGVSQGRYEIYVSAAGFPEQKVAENIHVVRGQSLSLDLYLRPGPEVQGEIFSKSGLSPSKWIQEFPISVVIYDSDDYQENSVISYSPLNLTHSPYMPYVQGDTVFDVSQTNPSPYVVGGLLAPNKPKLAAFPWEGPISYYSYTLNPNTKDLYGIFNGVGPAQVWWVSPSGTLDAQTGLGSTSNSFRFQFGARGIYGAPAKLSGMIPQIYATWIDGLTARTYFVKSYVHGYVQTTSSGSVTVDYPIKIASTDQNIAVYVQMDLYRSGVIDVSARFHDTPGTNQESMIGGPDPARYLIAEAIDYAGRTAALNFTKIPSSASSARITLSGTGMAGCIFPPDTRSGVKYSLLQYQNLRDYGILPGIYTIRVYVRGYIQSYPSATSLLELDVAPRCLVTQASYSLISLHMYRGGGINATIRSTDWQIPRNTRNWLWNSTEAALLVYDMASKSFVDAVYFWNSTAQSWTIPRTNSQFSSIPWQGWKARFGMGSSYLYTNGSTILERFGPAPINSESSDPIQDMATNLFVETTFRPGFLFSTKAYRTSTYKTNVAIYPGKYALTVSTYGYVQEGVYVLGDLGRVSVSVPTLNSQANSNIPVMNGITFNLTFVFRNEGIFQGLPFNCSMRIRIYDESDQIVAAASTSYDPGVVITAAGFYADQKKISKAGASVSPIPAGTKIVEYRMLAGQYRYTELATGIEIVERAKLFSTDYGIWGSYTSNTGYTGKWTIKVEIVNWYLPKKFNPAPPALLHGESAFLYQYNHLGPYELRTNEMIQNHRLGGGISAILALDARAYVSGHVYQYSWFDEPRTSSWAVVTMKGQTQSFRSYSLDGFFEAYLSPENYEFSVSILISGEDRVFGSKRTIRLPDGAIVQGGDYYLENSG